MSARIIGDGLGGAARRVADHARELVRLELRLAATEIKRKVVALATGLGLVAGAIVLLLIALLVGVAAAAAGIATALGVWQALLVTFGALFVLALALGAVGVRFLRRGSKPVPEQALEEARLTTEALRNGH
ncbi:MAG: phage holin family protein [Actinobacteria bacterium]|nr:phage holin family protein [Actinomycetota bacterium]MBV8479048.1 phage holin family protein [Actinomycetota bacterium]